MGMATRSFHEKEIRRRIIQKTGFLVSLLLDVSFEKHGMIISDFPTSIYRTQLIVNSQYHFLLKCQFCNLYHSLNFSISCLSSSGSRGTASMDSMYSVRRVTQLFFAYFEGMNEVDPSV
jgi:hypothetical protein